MFFLLVFLRIFALLSLSFVVSLSSTSIGNKDHKDSSTISLPPPPFQCHLYIAPSRIPNGGFGVYTTKDHAKGDFLQPYPDAPSIPICHMKGNYYNFQGQVFYDYTWSGSGQAEFECDEAAESVMNVGALINYHTVLKNIIPIQNGYNDDEFDHHDHNDTNARNINYGGAISHQMGYTFQLTQDISAGSEIFGDYGETWLDTRTGSYADHVPRAKDYRKAIQILRDRIIPHLDSQQLLEQDKYTPTKTSSFTDAHIQSLVEVIQYFKPRVGHAIPSNLQLLKEFMDKYTKYNQLNHDTSHHDHRQNETQSSEELSVILGDVLLQNHRTVDWVEKHGVCIEWIRSGKSTIPHAGRGAFSNTFLPMGSLISPAPLLTVVDETKFRMSRRKDDDDDEEEEEKEVEDDDHDSDDNENPSPCPSCNKKQPHEQQHLLLNYCFSHLQSSIILCPQTNAILINHSSTRQEYGDGSGSSCNTKNGPNAYIRWAKDWDENTEQWLNKTVDEIKEESSNGRRGLSLEVIALRDIQPNEEIFIDYGEHWEQAWKEYVHAESIRLDSNHTRTFVDQKSIRSLIQTKDFRTMEEQKMKPYPYYAQNVCIYPDANDHIDEEEEEEDDEEEGDNDEMYPKDKEPERKGDKYISKNMDAEYKVYPCEILERFVHQVRNPKLSRYHLGGFETIRTYTVRVFLGKEFNFKTVRLTEYPEVSISFRVKPYQSPQLRDGAFRHFIEIPDDIFPDNWKDLNWTTCASCYSE